MFRTLSDFDETQPPLRFINEQGITFIASDDVASIISASQSVVAETALETENDAIAQIGVITCETLDFIKNSIQNLAMETLLYSE